MSTSQITKTALGDSTYRYSTIDGPFLVRKCSTGWTLDFLSDPTGKSVDTMGEFESLRNAEAALFSLVS